MRPLPDLRRCSQLLLAVLWVFGPVGGAAVAAEPLQIELASDGQARLPIVISPDASEATRETAAELSDYLGQITGAKFETQTGDGSRGIVVGRPSEFTELPFAVQFGSGPFEREEYVLRTETDGLYLLGATDLAVSHAVWDLLYRIGYRQFFPGDTWEVVPHAPRLKAALDAREAPAFHARRIWYNWGLWGYNKIPYQQWRQRNRMAKGFDLHSGHAYDAIVRANRAEFDQHPEYFALIDGKREHRGGDTKFCIANPGLRKLVVAHARRVFEKNPQADSISMDPSDGGGWCECSDCAEVGSVSNRVVMLANEVAAAINQLDLGPKYVGMYAYNRHAAPPTLRVHPRVIPSATTAFIGGGYTFDQVVEGWQAQGATLGVYDYLSVVDWDWNLPRGAKASRAAKVAAFLPKVHAQGVRFYDAESGDCWGPCGLGYYVASRVLWDVDESQQFDAIVDDFLDKAFGPAREPMQKFYHLITVDAQRRSPSDIIGRMYRHLAAAREKTDDPKIRARIDHLILYTRHAELYYAYANGNGSKDDVARHAYRIRKTMMVHSYGLWSRLVSQRAALTPEHPLKDETPVSADEIDQILARGIEQNQPVEAGFETVSFSDRLVPAAERLELATSAVGSFPSAPQDRQLYHIWVPQGGGSVDLTATVEKVWANRMPEIKLFSPQEVSLDPVAVNDAYRPDGKPYAMKLQTPYAGLHRVEPVDGGDHTRINWPAGMQVTLESGPETPYVQQHFRGEWTLYFYVPKGTKVVAGWAARVAHWAPRLSGKLLNADGEAVFDFAGAEDGFFKVPVAAGQDGRLWKFEKNQGQRLLMTVPPYLARRAEELLLPTEVVEADAAP